MPLGHHNLARMDRPCSIEAPVKPSRFHSGQKATGLHYDKVPSLRNLIPGDKAILQSQLQGEVWGVSRQIFPEVIGEGTLRAPQSSEVGLSLSPTSSLSSQVFIA